jgi:hypothetical protein
MSNLPDRVRSRKSPVLPDHANYPAHLTTKLGNVDTRNLTCGVALATLDRWEIPHADGVAYLRRSEARNLRRAWFGSRGVRVRPAGAGTMIFRLFDGVLRMEFVEPQTWEEAIDKPAPGMVRLAIRSVGQ